MAGGAMWATTALEWDEPNPPVAVAAADPAFIDDVTAIRIAVVGDANVGCTSFTTQFAHGIYDERSEGGGGGNSCGGGNSGGAAAEAVPVQAREIRIDDRLFIAELWDVGSRDSSETSQMAYDGAHAVAIMYDTTRPDTFEAAAGWVRSVRARCRRPVIPIALIGNKADVVEREDAPVSLSWAFVSTEYAASKARDLGASHFVVSSKTGHMVAPAVYDLAEDAMMFMVMTPAKPPPPEWEGKSADGKIRKTKVLAGLPRTQASQAEAAVESLLEQRELVASSPRCTTEGQWERGGARCNGCSNAFGVSRWRYNCRVCGKLFCGRCSNKKFELDVSSYESDELDVRAERVCNGCHDRLLTARTRGEDEHARREQEVEEAVNRLSALQACNGFFPDVYADDVTTNGLVQFMQMYGDEEFLRAKKLWKVRPRDVTWKKGRSLRTYQRMLQRFRDWGDDGPTEGVSSGGTPHGTPRGEGGPGDGMTWAVETEHDGSDDEEGTTVQVLALESPRDSPRGSSPVKYAAITSDHVLHAEAASEYLAARHWKCIRDEGLGHDHADTLEIRSTLELLQLEITKLRTASCEHTAAEHTPLLSSSGVIGGAVPIPIGHANSSSAKPPKATRRLELRLEPAAPGTHRDHVGAGAEPGSPDGFGSGSMLEGEEVRPRVDSAGSSSDASWHSAQHDVENEALFRVDSADSNGPPPVPAAAAAAARAGSPAVSLSPERRVSDSGSAESAGKWVRGQWVRPPPAELLSPEPHWQGGPSTDEQALLKAHDEWAAGLRAGDWVVEVATGRDGQVEGVNGDGTVRLVYGWAGRNGKQQQRQQQLNVEAVTTAALRPPARKMREMGSQAGSPKPLATGPSKDSAE